MSEHIKKSLTQFLKELKKKHEETGEVTCVFEQLFDERIKKHIKGYRRYKSTVTVYVDSAAWSYEVNLLKGNILEKFRQGKTGIENIKIKVKAK